MDIRKQKISELKKLVVEGRRIQEQTKKEQFNKYGVEQLGNKDAQAREKKAIDFVDNYVKEHEKKPFYKRMFR